MDKKRHRPQQDKESKRAKAEKNPLQVFADGWREANDRVSEGRSPEWIAAFGFNIASDVHGTLAGYNDRTFPKDMRWHDQLGTIWRRAGLNVFDFKRSSRKPIPSGEVVLTRRAHRSRVLMTCVVIRAFRSSRALVGEAIAPGNDRPIYSRNCGRAELRIKKVRVEDY